MVITFNREMQKNWQNKLIILYQTILVKLLKKSVMVTSLKVVTQTIVPSKYMRFILIVILWILISGLNCKEKHAKNYLTLRLLQKIIWMSIEVYRKRNCIFTPSNSFSVPILALCYRKR